MNYLKFTRNNVPVLIRNYSVVLIEPLLKGGSVITVETVSGCVLTNVDESPTEVHHIIQTFNIEASKT